MLFPRATAPAAAATATPSPSPSPLVPADWPALLASATEVRLVAVYSLPSSHDFAPFDDAIRYVSLRSAEVRTLPPALRRWSTLSTHTWLEWWAKRPDGTWARVAIEATMPKVRYRAPATPQDDVRAYAVRATPEQVRASYAYAVTLIGHPYDFIGLLVSGWYGLFAQPDHWFQNHHASFYCSEMCMDVRRAVGLPLWPQVDADNSLPAGNEAWDYRYSAALPANQLAA